MRLAASVLLAFTAHGPQARTRAQSTTETDPYLVAVRDQQSRDEQQIDMLFRRHNCSAAYLDVGTNIGVQIRKLYEPHKYPSAGVLPVFRASFGRESSRCHVCTIGFEPNPHHVKRLSELEARLRRAGAGVLVFHAAAGATDGAVTLRTPVRKNQFQDAGANTLETSSPTTGKYVLHRVRMIQLSRILRHVRTLTRDQVLVKLDIEGAEWTVLPELMATRALCSANRIFIEYHDAWLKSVEAVAPPGAVLERASYRIMASSLPRIRTELEAALQKLNRSGVCNVELLSIDDETFLNDGRSFANHVCGHRAIPSA